MKIGIIMYPYGEKKPGGLPRIIFGWAEALISVDKVSEYLIFFKDQITKPPALPRGNWKTFVLGPGRFWLNRLKKYPEADVYLFNTPVLPFLWKPRRAVVIALDYPYKYLKAESLKQWLFRFFISWYHGYSMRRADHIISVSDSTKNDTIKFFGIPKEKITTVYHGYVHICEYPEKTVDFLPEKYFFFAGTIKERKNVLAIVKGLESLIKKHPEFPHKLAIGGKNEGKYYEMMLRYIKECNLEDRVVFLGHLNENQLSYAYKRAEGLVFPSIVEGTGFPILESMGCGTPVVTSNIFGPAEMGANGGAVLINPYKPEEIGDAMERLITDPEFRANQIKKGLEQAARFSWTNTGKETLAILEKVAWS